MPDVESHWINTEECILSAHGSSLFQRMAHAQDEAQEAEIGAIRPCASEAGSVETNGKRCWTLASITLKRSPRKALTMACRTT